MSQPDTPTNALPTSEAVEAVPPVSPGEATPADEMRLPVADDDLLWECRVLARENGAADPFESARALKPAVLYLHLFPAMRDRAKELGYALALHGSLGKDMDLLAVPWTDQAVPAEALVTAICEVAGLYVRPWAESHPEPVARSHGRLTWTLVPGGPLFIDLSVMPIHAATVNTLAQGSDPAIRDAVKELADAEFCCGEYDENPDSIPYRTLVERARNAKGTLLALIAAQCAAEAAPNLFNGWDAEHWGLNYEELRDACDKFLPPDLLHDGEEAEAWLYEQSIRRAGEEITRLRAEAARVRDAALEEAAKVCEAGVAECQGKASSVAYTPVVRVAFDDKADALGVTASRIRALREAPHE